MLRPELESETWATMYEEYMSNKSTFTGKDGYELEDHVNSMMGLSLYDLFYLHDLHHISFHGRGSGADINSMQQQKRPQNQQRA